MGAPGADGEGGGGGNSGVGATSQWGGRGNSGRGSKVRVSSTSKNRPSHHKYKSPKHF